MEVARLESWGIHLMSILLTLMCSALAAHDFFDDHNDLRKATTVLEASDCIIDIREYDVPYHVRVAIDRGTVRFHTFNFGYGNLTRLES